MLAACANKPARSGGRRRRRRPAAPRRRAARRTSSSMSATASSSRPTRPTLTAHGRVDARQAGRLAAALSALHRHRSRAMPTSAAPANTTSRSAPAAPPACTNYLASRGISPARIRTISYGKERPVAVCNDISCWSQNRRAVTVLDSWPGRPPRIRDAAASERSRRCRLACVKLWPNSTVLWSKGMPR